MSKKIKCDYTYGSNKNAELFLSSVAGKIEGFGENLIDYQIIHMGGVKYSCLYRYYEQSKVQQLNEDTDTPIPRPTINPGPLATGQNPPGPRWGGR